MAKQLTKKAVKLIENLNHAQEWLLYVLDLYINSPDNLRNHMKAKSIDWYIGNLAATQSTIECILHLENAYNGFQCCIYPQGYEGRSYNLKTSEPTPNSDKLHRVVHEVSAKQRTFTQEA